MSGTEAIHRCWAEVDLAALCHNAAVARQRCGTSLMAVVKANAYGHGAIEVARALQPTAAFFGVANVHEACELRAAGVETPILLLSPCLPEEMPVAIAAGLHICVSSVPEAVAVDRTAASLGCTALVHAVVDTGMGRMGFTPEAWTDDALRALLALPHLYWEGIASHLASADEDADFTHRQIADFHAAEAKARTLGFRPRCVHVANSAGLLGFDDGGHALGTLARPGLMLYGIAPLADYQSLLKPVLAWKTRVALVRRLPADHGVSYGRTYVTPSPTVVATLACGYADGYPRQISNRGGAVLIGGKRCPLLGRVTMDQMMVDVSALPEVPETGAEAVLLGSQGEASISATELAAQAGTIPWHILTGIGPRVERVYLRA